MHLTIVKEVNDARIIYGVIESELAGNELQKEIDNIKDEMTEKERESFTIDDVVDKLNRKGYISNFTDTQFGVLI